MVSSSSLQPNPALPRSPSPSHIQIPRTSAYPFLGSPSPKIQVSDSRCYHVCGY
jgi:hypothetical protein